MKLVRYRRGETTSSGILVDGHVIDLATASRSGPASVASSIPGILTGGVEALAAVQTLADGAQAAARIPLAELVLLSPLADVPHNIYCVGRNYMDHVAEGDRLRGVATAAPDYPQFFTKTSNTLTGPTGDIPYWSTVTQQLDYEVELALIIGRAGRDIPKADAWKHIFGYTVANDVSARDLQRRHGQWFKGKSLDGSLPLGPCIVTADEIPDPTCLDLTLTVNGALRQSAQVSQMIFDIPTIIEQLSAGLTLSVGDVILTGTPAGVGAAMTPPVFLQHGDEVVCTISGIGELRNRVAEMGVAS